MEDSEKEKTRTYVTHVQRDHQVWSSGDEDEEIDNNRKKENICMVAASEEDKSTIMLHRKGLNPQHRQTGKNYDLV